MLFLVAMSLAEALPATPASAGTQYDVAASFTRGRDSLEIELDARLSPSPWIAFDYAVASHVDPLAEATP